MYLENFEVSFLNQIALIKTENFRNDPVIVAEDDTKLANIWK